MIQDTRLVAQSQPLGDLPLVPKAQVRNHRDISSIGLTREVDRVDVHVRRHRVTAERKIDSERSFDVERHLQNVSDRALVRKEWGQIVVRERNREGEALPNARVTERPVDLVATGVVLHAPGEFVGHPQIRPEPVESSAALTQGGRDAVLDDRPVVDQERQIEEITILRSDVGSDGHVGETIPRLLCLYARRDEGGDECEEDESCLSHVFFTFLC